MEDDHDQPSLFDDPRPPIVAPTPHVGHRHPETAQAMQRRALPHSGTFRYAIYAALQQEPRTDDELEVMFQRSHQSVSGARATLKKDGWVKDSGVRRLNRWGNEAIVWMVA